MPDTVPDAAGIVAPVRLKTKPVKLAVPVVQVVVAAPAATKPAGKVSENAAPVIAIAFGLLKVMIKSETCAWLTVAGENTLTMLGLSNTCTVSEALLLLVVAAVSPPPATLAVLVMLRGAVADTLTLTVKLGAAAPAAMTPEYAQAIGLAALQVQPATAGILTKLKPVGRLSLRLIVPMLLPPPVFRTVKVKLAPEV